jgi:hypothetical protein
MSSRHQKNGEIIMNSPHQHLTGHYEGEYLEYKTQGNSLKETNPKDLSFGKKPPLSLIPASAAILMAAVMEHGAIKRSPYNWRNSKISILQTLDKTFRHLYKYQDGQDFDEETNLLELAHAAADLIVLIDAVETGCIVDDRPKKGVAGKLIERLTKK